MGKKITKPLYQADWQQIDKMCAISCTGEEMASVLGVDYDTLVAACKRDHKSRFSEYIKQKSLGGKMSLRRKQYDQAMSGNSTMLIWLGKQWLKQAEKVDDLDSEGAQPLSITFNVSEPVEEIKVTNAKS